MNREDILALIVKKAEEHGINHELVLAICEVESGFNPNKNRFEPDYQYTTLVAGHATRLFISYATEHTNQSISWGLMQIMGGTARTQGFIGDMCELCSNVGLGLDHGLIYLKSKIARYPDSLEDAIAAYNAGHAEKTIDGKYVNSDYVDKVRKALSGKKWVVTGE